MEEFPQIFFCKEIAMSNFTVTISRTFGSGGRTIGKMLAERLGIHYYDNELIKLASEESGINIELFGKADEKAKTALFKRYNRSYGEYLISPDSGDFTSDDNLFNYQAKIIKDLAAKENCVLVGRCAIKEIERIDRARSTYYRYYTGCDWDNVRNYDLCLNTADVGFEKSVDIIEHCINLLYVDR